MLAEHRLYKVLCKISHRFKGTSYSVRLLPWAATLVAESELEERPRYAKVDSLHTLHASEQSDSQVSTSSDDKEGLHVRNMNSSQSPPAPHGAAICVKRGEGPASLRQ